MSVTLTDSQKQAITDIGNANILCMASAGSGKTHCFTHRIAYMIRKLGSILNQFYVLLLLRKQVKK